MSWWRRLVQAFSGRQLEEARQQAELELQEARRQAQASKELLASRRQERRRGPRDRRREAG